MGFVVQASMSSRYNERKLASQLLNARKALQTLDGKEGIEGSYLWPSDEPEEEEEGEAVGGETAAGDAESTEEALWRSFTTSEKLSLVCTYLRRFYQYCVYCGHQYESPEELAKDCPGLTEEDH
jgi:hypothetical protein